MRHPLVWNPGCLRCVVARDKCRTAKLLHFQLSLPNIRHTVHGWILLKTTKNSMEGNDPSARKFSTLWLAHVFPTFALHELPPGMQVSLHNVLHQTLLYNARDVFEEFCCQSGLRREASSRFTFEPSQVQFCQSLYTVHDPVSSTGVFGYQDFQRGFFGLSVTVYIGLPCGSV